MRNGAAERLSCEGPHRGEIYGRFELTGRKAFPGTEEVMKASRDRCGPLLPDYAVDLTAHGPLQTYFSHPDRAGWERGGRTVLCWAGAPRGDLDEPIRKEESAFAPVQLAYVSAFRPLWEAQLRPPQRGPEEDLATASRWAGQMAAAYAEAARLLGDARGGLPGDVREPAGEIVVVFEAAVPRWERAARAADSDAYLAAIEQAGRDNDLAVGLDAEIRKGVGLPVPRSAAAGSGEGV
ncbi:septum formation family protein [Streptomyces sp. BpilaLS-43]|uniref:septum formation family protein n=1 Tax=Streptomyces sp. BpilaLS-43 TaxID=1839778 RepID=UPI00351F375B